MVSVLTSSRHVVDPLHKRQTVVERGPDLKVTIPELDGVDELSARVFRAFLGTAKLHMHLMMRSLADSGTHPGQLMCLRVLTVNDLPLGHRGAGIYLAYHRAREQMAATVPGALTQLGVRRIP